MMFREVVNEIGDCHHVTQLPMNLDQNLLDAPALESMHNHRQSAFLP